jgi:hypothetical protein
LEYQEPFGFGHAGGLVFRHSPDKTCNREAGHLQVMISRQAPELSLYAKPNDWHKHRRYANPGLPWRTVVNLLHQLMQSRSAGFALRTAHFAVPIARPAAGRLGAPPEYVVASAGRTANRAR